MAEPVLKSAVDEAAWLPVGLATAGRKPLWGVHLHVFQWARDHCCPWNASTCAFAAADGYLT